MSSTQISQSQTQECKIPDIKCKNHKTCSYSAINPNTTNIENILVCIKCIREQQLNIGELTLIDDIYQNENIFIENLPQINDQIGQSIDNTLNAFQLNVETQRVKDSFKSFQTQISTLINSYQNMIVEYLQSIEKKKLNILNMFEYIQQTNIKEQIRQQFENYKFNLSELQCGLDKIISKENEKEFIQRLDDYAIYQQQFDIKQINKQLSQIFNHFSEQLQQLTYTFGQQEINMSYSSILNSESKERINNIQDLQQRITLVNQQIEDEDIQKKYDISKSINISRYEITNENKVDLFPYQVETKRCITIQKQNIGEFTVYHDQCSTDDETITLQILQPKKKYQISIKILSQDKKILQFGLSLTNKFVYQKELKKPMSKLNLSTEKSGSGVDTVEQGNHISAVIDEVDLITIQICLNEKVFKCQAITNNQRNINSLGNWDQIKKNVEYNFQVTFCQPQQKIAIKEFREVQEFDQW